MAKVTKDIVVVAGYCINDNWYGDRYRHILSETKGVGFTSMTAAKRFSARLKKVIAKKLHLMNKPLSGELYIEVGERKSFVDYTYHSFGPAESYKHIDLDVEGLIEQVDKIAAEKKHFDMWGY